MMDLVMILSFLGAAVVLTVMPGPDNLYTLAQSIANDKRAGIWTTLGLCTGLLVHIAAAVIGLSALIYQSAFAFSIVKYAGAAYLCTLLISHSGPGTLPWPSRANRLWLTAPFTKRA